VKGSLLIKNHLAQSELGGEVQLQRLTKRLLDDKNGLGSESRLAEKRDKRQAMLKKLKASKEEGL